MYCVRCRWKDCDACGECEPQPEPARCPACGEEPEAYVYRLQATGEIVGCDRCLERKPAPG